MKKSLVTSSGNNPSVAGLPQPKSPLRPHRMMRASRAEISLKDSNGNRAGTVLVIFMLSLAMLSLTAAAMLRVTLLQRSMVRSNELRIQSEWLFQSAVARASSELNTNAEYAGEEWKITAESLSQSADAVTNISVDAVDGKTNERQVTITVLYPPDDTERATVTRTVSISL